MHPTNRRCPGLLQAAIRPSLVNSIIRHLFVPLLPSRFMEGLNKGKRAAGTESGWLR